MSSALEAILGGGAGAPPGAPAGSAPPSIPDPEPHLAAPSDPASGPGDPAGGPGGPDQPRDEVTVLQDLLGLTSEYLGIASVEPGEAVKMKKVELSIHELLDANQKAVDSVTGANPQLRKVMAAGA